MRQGYMDPVVSKENTISTAPTGPASTASVAAAADGDVSLSGVTTLSFFAGDDSDFPSSDREEKREECVGKEEDTLDNREVIKKDCTMKRMRWERREEMEKREEEEEEYGTRQKECNHL